MVFPSAAVSSSSSVVATRISLAGWLFVLVVVSVLEVGAAVVGSGSATTGLVGAGVAGGSVVTVGSSGGTGASVGESVEVGADVGCLDDFLLDLDDFLLDLEKDSSSVAAKELSKVASKVGAIVLDLLDLNCLDLADLLDLLLLELTLVGANVSAPISDGSNVSSVGSNVISSVAPKVASNVGAKVEQSEEEDLLLALQLLLLLLLLSLLLLLLLLPLFNCRSCLEICRMVRVFGVPSLAPSVKDA